MKALFRLGIIGGIAIIAYYIGKGAGRESVRRETRGRGEPFLRGRGFVALRPGGVVAEYRMRHPGHVDLQH